jgi:hypothetical protein
MLGVTGAGSLCTHLTQVLSDLKHKPAFLHLDLEGIENGGKNIAFKMNVHNRAWTGERLSAYRMLCEMEAGDSPMTCLMAPLRPLLSAGVARLRAVVREEKVAMSAPAVVNRRKMAEMENKEWANPSPLRLGGEVLPSTTYSFRFILISGTCLL